MASDNVAPRSAIIDRGGRTWSVEEIAELVSRASADEASAIATLKSSFDASQWLWDYITESAAEDAEENLIKASETKEFWRLAARRRLARTRNGLAGPSPTPLVRLAARNAALCSLEADLAHRSSAERLAKNEVPSEALQRWLDRADARFRKALKCLADLQRLQLPTVQVNVGGQQVNIATAQLNLPGSSGEAPIETAPDTSKPVVVTATAAPRPALASPTSATDAQMNARSQGGREPADAATRELGEGLAAPSETAGATRGTPDAFLRSECPTPGTSGTVPPGVSPPRSSAPPSRPSPAARRRAPARRDRRGTDPRRAAPRGTNQPEHVKGAAVMRDALPALIRGRRTAERRGRTRSPPAGGAGKRSR